MCILSGLNGPPSAVLPNVRRGADVNSVDEGIKEGETYES